MVLNMVIVGVGGQGILSLARMIGEAIIKSNENSDINVSIAETHGLSQRGGSVITHVRIGKGVIAPTIAKGDADIMLGLELIESVRYIDYLKRGRSVAIVDDRIIRPSIPKIEVPRREDALRIIGDTTFRFYLLKASEEAIKKGSPLSANMVFYGFITYMLSSVGLINKSIATDLAASIGRGRRISEINVELYTSGYQLASRLVDEEVLRLVKKSLKFKL